MKQATRADLAAAVDRSIHLIEPLVGHWPLAGGVVAIVTKNEVVAVRPFGHADLAARHPVGHEHLFEIGSISKVFTGLLALGLVEEGLIDLSAPVTRYLPWFQIESDASPITIRDLLQHGGGLIMGADDPPDALAQCWALRDTAVGSAPGTHFHYSNLGYMLLGMTIEAVTGVPVADLCRKRLLEPLGMTSTLVPVSEDGRSRLAIGYTPAAEDRPWVPDEALAPATWLAVDGADGNVASNGTDMAAFLRMLLGRGRLDGREVVSAETIERMVTDLGPGGEDWVDGFGARPVETTRYGLGINVETIGGHLCMTHGGGMVGYSSFVLADLSADVGICVLTNANGNHPVGQVVARLCHTLATTPDRPIPPLDMTLITSGFGFHPDMIGTFSGVDDQGARREITVVDIGGVVALTSEGETVSVFRTWGTRFVIDHPALRRFSLTFAATPEGPVWVHGGTTMRRSDAAPLQSEGDRPRTPDGSSGLVGRYRSHSPWYPTFRIVLRGETLFLIAPEGVEAPMEDAELVEIRPGVFRVGRDEWLPERLVVGPRLDGRAVWVSVDGNRYSRSALP